MSRTHEYRRVFATTFATMFALTAAQLCYAGGLSEPSVPPSSEPLGHQEELAAARAELAIRVSHEAFVANQVTELERAVRRIHAQYMVTGDPKLGFALDEAFMELDVSRRQLNATRARISVLQQKITELSAKIVAARKR